MIAGRGLHTGAASSVRFERADGPIAFEQGDATAGLHELEVVDTTRSTTVASRDGRVRIGTVEHLLAALAGLGVREGVRVIVDGSELPLADGGAAAYFDAVAALEAPASGPALVVAREGEIAVGASRYRFEPGGQPLLEVSIDFDDPRLARVARWDGEARSFRASIAAARTFGFGHEVLALAERGLASHVDPESVVVIAQDEVLSAGAPFTADEPARHKLLDLAGDLYLHGGPPRGRVVADRPGHAATHAAIGRALEAGILSRIGSWIAYTGARDAT